MGKTVAPGLGGEKEKDRRWIRQRQKGGDKPVAAGPGLLAAGDRRDGGRQQAGRQKPAQRKVSA